MEVVLLERIEKLGQMGDVVKVKNGFARNFLLPQNKALRATEANMATFEAQRAQLEARNLEMRKDAEAVGAKIEGTKIVLVRQASEADHLYGSVSAKDIAEALTEHGFSVDKAQIILGRPIKLVGLFDVRVSLHPEVSVGINVNVARTSDEAQAQASASEDAVLAEANAVFESAELAQHAVDDMAEADAEEEALAAGDTDSISDEANAEESAEESVGVASDDDETKQ